MRILIVDDSEDSRDLAEGTLLSAGYDDLVTVASGWEALKVLDIGRNSDERPAFDIVLLDVVMAEMDGVETCARIRNDPRYSDLPIIMVTSCDDTDTLSNAFVAGATDYITKPVNRMEMVARVRAALRLKAELDRRQSRERELLGFLSSWGNRRASLWIDEATGLFVGEVAEAYLTSAVGYESSDAMSILAMTIDRLEGYRAAHGDRAANGVLSQVARAVRGLAANIGIIAASYRNGMIILVAPEFGANSARELGEALHSTITKLRLPNSESIAADHVTASVATVTGLVKGSIERVHLLTQAIAKVQDAAAAGGNRVLALSV
jgi:sigma-B regulation protein RsbU (phosphoserine phosphatase)